MKKKKGERDSISIKIKTLIEYFCGRQKKRKMWGMPRRILFLFLFKFVNLAKKAREIGGILWLIFEDGV